MKKNWFITSITTAVIVTAIIAGLNWLALPNFVAGQVASQGKVLDDDYFVTKLDHNKEYDRDSVWKLAKLRRGWGAVPEAWPAILPLLILGISETKITF